MPLSVSGEKDYNGFILSEPFIHHGNLIVLTGRNGCGKTRLLESIQKNMSGVDLGGERLKDQEIMLVEQGKLTPNFGGAYNDAQFQTKITSSLQMYDQVKSDFDSPLDRQKAQNQSRRMYAEGLPYEALYNLCRSIGHQLS